MRKLTKDEKEQNIRRKKWLAAYRSGDCKRIKAALRNILIRTFGHV